MQPGVKPGQNIMCRAAAIRPGADRASPGKLLRPLEIGLLAEVGRAVVSVIPSPQIAILATGNELVS